ncbi:hypothetical protein CRE_29121 [Caenorhabditis remanei]|uniref:Uncharacterized protein n=1 Tax=Caenorhabditis remanei TaxID=31234 RepID=E3N4M7_CAERE|nr:hypothetical protein CRE_29121 [Caenorhabditis remanei]
MCDIYKRGGAKLLSCEGFQNGKEKTACMSQFHSECIKNYNDGEFFFQYAALPECQNKLLCPLHWCYSCNKSGHRQSAAIEKVERTLEERDDGGKMCPRVHHQNRVFVKRIDKEMADKNQCDICRENRVIRVNSPVLAKVNFHFWLGITRKWDDYPNKKESIVPLNKVVHLTTKYFKMPRKEEEKKLWEDAVAKFKSRGEFPKEMQQPNSSKRQMLWKNEGWSSAEEKMMLTKGKKIKCSAFRGDM